MRKLTEMEAMVDYQKDPVPNPKHEPHPWLFNHHYVQNFNA
jgi:hypothetical protein